MSNDRQQVNYGHAHTGIGVIGFGPSKEIYVASKHNNGAPLRTGSMDAFKHPSLDHTGKRKPYWGTKE
jgi:hypothetical protein